MKLFPAFLLTCLTLSTVLFGCRPSSMSPSGVSGSCNFGETSCYQYAGLASTEAATSLCSGGARITACPSKGCLGTCTADSTAGKVKGFFYTGTTESIGTTCSQGGGTFSASCD